jgi:hypothetical protein
MIFTKVHPIYTLLFQAATFQELSFAFHVSSSLPHEQLILPRLITATFEGSYM